MTSANVKYYLRIEGVNLSNFVYDTQDLSTSRGGGLLLLQAVKQVEEKFSNLTSISTGASVGLFSFEAKSDADATMLRDEVLKCLKGHAGYATFVVDVLPANGGFRDAVERVIALNRFRQMSSPTLVYPDRGSSGQVCDVDYVRPATQDGSWRGEEPNRRKERISDSVEARRKYGRKQKQEFYRALLPGGTPRDEITPDAATVGSEQAEALGALYRFLASDGEHFTHDLEELTTRGTDEPLGHKMAVIYIDGNGFGKIQAECGDETTLESWDKTIKSSRARLVAALLAEAYATTWPDGSKPWLTDKGKLRFETLLWGGDELIWVVPAWTGWWTLAKFYELSETWSWPPNGQPLKHAASIIFCNYKAPIHRMTDMAKSLAEICKKGDWRKENRAAYLVLESFDIVGGYRDYVRERYRERIEVDALTLHGDDLSDWIGLFTQVKRILPTRRAFGVLHSALGGPGNLKRLHREARQIIERGGLSTEFDRLLGTVPEKPNPAAWAHLVELWDYIAPEVEVEE
ncbi:MAG: hypothetical protein ACT4QB_19380 [Gammaproteobacteria bacterium]